jgi:hypothetical protein
MPAANLFFELLDHRRTTKPKAPGRAPSPAARADERGIAVEHVALYFQDNPLAGDFS